MNLKAEKITYSKAKGKSDAFDQHIGKKLRALRMSNGLSQEQLAMKAGITFQQLQKYESGTNRISATRLYTFAKLLAVPITIFYEGYEKNNETESVYHTMESDAELLLLMRDWKLIEDKNLKKAMLNVIRGIIKAEKIRP